MSHTEKQNVTYYSGHVIEINGKRYVKEPTFRDNELDCVVRCRDCEYSFIDDTGNIACSQFDDPLSDAYAHVEPDGFCAWGEEKER